MAYCNSLGTEIPGYLWELGVAVRSLIDQYDAMDLWRRHVRRWVELVEEEAEKDRQKYEQEAVDDCISFPSSSWVNTSKQ